MGSPKELTDAQTLRRRLQEALRRAGMPRTAEFGLFVDPRLEGVQIIAWARSKRDGCAKLRLEDLGEVGRLIELLEEAEEPRGR